MDFFKDILIFFYLKRRGVEFNFRRVNCFGLPIIRRAKGSRIIIEDDVTLDSKTANNVFGINHPVILATIASNAVIHLKEKSGVSGASLVAASKIEVGRYSGLGGNSAIYDTDFHPIDPDKRRKQISLSEAKSKAVIIGDDVLIGGNSIILKGVEIGNGAFIGAGSVVTRNIPPREVWAGNPAQFLRSLDD